MMIKRWTGLYLMCSGQAQGDGFQTSKEDTGLTHNLNLPPRSLSAPIAPVHAILYIAPPTDPFVLGKAHVDTGRGKYLT